MLAGSGLLAICLAGAETALNLKGNGKPNTHRTHIIVIHMMHPYDAPMRVDMHECVFMCIHVHLCIHMHPCIHLESMDLHRIIIVL